MKAQTHSVTFIYHIQLAQTRGKKYNNILNAGFYFETKFVYPVKKYGQLGAKIFFTWSYIISSFINLFPLLRLIFFFFFLETVMF